MRLQQQQQQQHRKRSFSGGNARKRDRNDLICVVCLAPAMGKKKYDALHSISLIFFFLLHLTYFSFIFLGYNFDQITCESCKAFFRRNALNNAVSVRIYLRNNFLRFSIVIRTNFNVAPVPMTVLLLSKHEKYVKKLTFSKYSLILLLIFSFSDVKRVD